MKSCHENGTLLLQRRASAQPSRLFSFVSLAPVQPLFLSISPSPALPSLASKQHNFIIVAVNTVIIKERGGERLPYYTFNENIADAH